METLRRLIVVRHAHRDKPHGGEEDNGLSEKGAKQARRVAQRFHREFGDAKAQVISSPKLRCRQTVEGIGPRVEISALLDEQGQGESWEAFTERVKRFLKWWRQEAGELVVLCSHGDWIPLFLELATSAKTDLAKGGWAEIAAVRDEKPQIEWVLQRLGG